MKGEKMTDPVKICFMGTPDFAVGALEALIAAGYEIVCVVTQPDKPKGRGKAVQFPPVKECARKHDIPVFQPVKIKAPEAVEELKKYEAELFVVAAFGQILSAEILQMPRYGCINIHASLLPKYRGAAPIQWAILNGETETGITIMQMNEGLDTGDMLAKRVVLIEPTETGDSLHDKLMAAGASLVTETIPRFVQGEITPEKQNDADSSYAKMLRKSLGNIDWKSDAASLARLVRGLNSWPGAYTVFRGKNLKIWEAQEAAETGQSRRPAGEADEAQPPDTVAARAGCDSPGTVVNVTRETIEVMTGRGILILKSVQPEGKKRMQVKDFLLGYPVKAGERLGE